MDRIMGEMGCARGVRRAAAADEPGAIGRCRRSRSPILDHLK